MADEGRKRVTDQAATGTEKPFGASEQFALSAALIVQGGTAAHRYGATAMRLEALLSDLSRTPGIDGVFRSTPSDILFALRQTPAAPRSVEIVSTEPPGMDLDKLSRRAGASSALRAGGCPLQTSSCAWIRSTGPRRPGEALP